MSPEQMSKSKAVDGRADIWALGVILYELLTAHSPFRAATLLEVASKVLQEEPKPLRDLRPEVPDGLVDVVTRCLRKRREDRFASVDELVLALQGFVSRDVAARLPMVSQTNIEQTNATNATNAASIVDTQADAQTLRIEASSPAGEPTSLTFGQTGKPKATRSRRPFVAAGFGLTIVVACVALWLGWRAPTADELASDSLAVAADASPAKDATSAAVATTTPSAIVVPDEPIRDDGVRGKEPVRAPSDSTSRSTTAPEKRVPVPEKPKTLAVTVVDVPATTPPPTAPAASSPPTTAPTTNPTTTKKRRPTAD
jgi:hypothetical protein